MRLLNAQTYQLDYFPDKGKRPTYAIISHVWGKEEVTFQDLNDLRNRARKMRAFDKLEHSCKLALINNILWVWLDTCCIDKESSAELSEAINSMYEWYKDAEVCYAFLSDVPPRSPEGATPEDHIRKSKWFTRGWTLQELLAPTKIVFVANDWTSLGNGNDLAVLVSKITGIDEDILRHLRSPADVSVARRMSWAANRETTRVEDRAYSLMGIFGVYMTTIYGEGENAFTRLQLQILRQIPDHSIFAWGPKETYESVLQRPRPSRYDWEEPSGVPRGLFAPSPSVFHGCADIEPVPWDTFLRVVLGDRAPEIERPPTSTFVQTPLGIQTTLPVITWLVPGHFLGVLACQRRDSGGRRTLVALPLYGEPAREALSIGWNLAPDATAQVRGVLLERPPTSGIPNILPIRARGKCGGGLKDIIIQSSTVHPLHTS